jgi:hypothetical protein
MLGAAAALIPMPKTGGGDASAGVAANKFLSKNRF